MQVIYNFKKFATEISRASSNVFKHFYDNLSTKESFVEENTDCLQHISYECPIDIRTRVEPPFVIYFNEYETMDLESKKYVKKHLIPILELYSIQFARFFLAKINTIYRQEAKIFIRHLVEIYGKSLHPNQVHTCFSDYCSSNLIEIVTKYYNIYSKHYM